MSKQTLPAAAAAAAVGVGVVVVEQISPKKKVKVYSKQHAI